MFRGRAVPAGTYYYVINLNEPNANLAPITGHVAGSDEEVDVPPHGLACPLAGVGCHRIRAIQRGPHAIPDDELVGQPRGGWQQRVPGPSDGGRNQWAGFDGALDSFASLSGRLGGGVTFAHGMGGFVVTDQVGPWSNTRLSLAYSTKVRLTNGARLSAGWRPA